MTSKWEAQEYEYRVRKPPEYREDPKIINQESPRLKKRKREYLGDIHAEEPAQKRTKVENSGSAERIFVLPKRPLGSGHTSPTGPLPKSQRFDFKEASVKIPPLFDDGHDVWDSSPFYNDRRKNDQQLIFEPETPRNLGGDDLMEEDNDEENDDFDEISTRTTIRIDLSDDEEEEDDVFVNIQPPDIHHRRPILTIETPKKNTEVINSPFFLHTPSKKYSRFMNSPSHKPKIRIGSQFQADIPRFNQMDQKSRKIRRDRSIELIDTEHNEKTQRKSTLRNNKMNRRRGGEIWIDGQDLLENKEIFDNYMKEGNEILVVSVPSTSGISYNCMLLDILRNHSFDFPKSLMFIRQNILKLKKKRIGEVLEVRQYCDFDI